MILSCFPVGWDGSGNRYFRKLSAPRVYSEKYPRLRFENRFVFTEMKLKRLKRKKRLDTNLLGTLLGNPHQQRVDQTC